MHSLCVNWSLQHVAGGVFVEYLSSSMISSSHSAKIGSTNTSVTCASKLDSSPSAVKHASNGQLSSRSWQKMSPILLQHVCTSSLFNASLHFFVDALFSA